MKELIVLIASILAVAGNIPYVISIIRRQTQPHAYTWFVWTIVSGIVFLGQVSKGAGVGAIPTFAAEVFTLINFLLSLKYGYKDITRGDTIILVIALIAIIPWILTSDPTISVVIAVSIDAIAFIPTLRKAWIEPTTENRWLYFSNVVRHGLTLFAIETYNVATVLHSVVMIVTNTTMTLILALRSLPDKLRLGEKKDAPDPRGINN